MTREERQRLARLAQVAGLIRDLAQAELAHRTRACAETRRHLADLDPPPAPETSLPPQVMEGVAMQHSRWAAPQKARLNATLAAQTAERMVAESKARTAVGRAQVLEKLMTRR